MIKPVIKVQREDFDLQRCYQQLREQATDPGAIVSFVGLVREFHQVGDDSPVQLLELEHYPGMTEKCLQDIALRAGKRWDLSAVTVVHRVGPLKAADQIVLVLTAASHRQAAFDGAQYIMDYLKSEAPFWKKQHRDSDSEWVSSRESDTEAIQRWSDDS